MTIFRSLIILGLLFVTPTEKEAVAQRGSQYFSPWVYMAHECVEHTIRHAYNTHREKFLATGNEKAWKKMKQLEAVLIACQEEGEENNETPFCTNEVERLWNSVPNLDVLAKIDPKSYQSINKAISFHKRQAALNKCNKRPQSKSCMELQNWCKNMRNGLLELNQTLGK